MVLHLHNHDCLKSLPITIYSTNMPITWNALFSYICILIKCMYVCFYIILYLLSETKQMSLQMKLEFRWMFPQRDMWNACEHSWTRWMPQQRDLSFACSQPFGLDACCSKGTCCLHIVNLLD